jgi:hypothetical protein
MLEFVGVNVFLSILRRNKKMSDKLTQSCCLRFHHDFDILIKINLNLLPTKFYLLPTAFAAGAVDPAGLRTHGRVPLLLKI